MITKLCVDPNKQTVTRVYPEKKDGTQPKPEIFEFDCDWVPEPRTASAMRVGASLVGGGLSVLYML